MLHRHGPGLLRVHWRCAGCTLGRLGGLEPVAQLLLPVREPTVRTTRAVAAVRPVLAPATPFDRGFSALSIKGP